MEAREAYERRVWRVGLLLTDDARAADEILSRVIDAQPELHKVGDTRLDRMVVQASRDLARDALPGATAEPPPPSQPLGEIVALDDPAARLWAGARDLGDQAREAWVFRELEGLDPIRAARAMDCSRHAVEEVHLEGARRTLRRRLGDELDEATRHLASALESIDAGGAIEEALRRAAAQRTRAVKRRRWVSALLLFLLLVCFALMIYVLIDLLGWDERHEMGKIRGERYSNPAPPQDEAAPDPAD